jgi:hypothetical protein
MPSLKEVADMDLAAEFNRPGLGHHPNSKPHQFKKGQAPPPGGGRKKGGNNKAVTAIKEFMVELLNDSHYRNGLVRRIKAGELPSVELFLLTKALGKPKEELEITANVPLFALPTSFVMKEDEVEAESVKVLTEGDQE